MTEERSHTDKVQDTLVSQTYRESAVEQVPDELDQAVLKRSRQHTSNRYSRSVIWLRPMAWAATIGLCLAIVVEINNVPQPLAEQMVLPAAPAGAMSAAEKLDEGAVEVQEIQVDAARTEMYEAEALQQRAKKTVDEQGRVILQDIPQYSKSETRESAFIPAEMRESVEPKETDALVGPMLEQVDGASNLRSITVTASPALATMIPASCDEKARVTPQTWLECIEALDEDGLEELAAEQREQLQEAFPDFDMP